jgi:valyl-tRNA synthetase
LVGKCKRLVHIKTALVGQRIPAWYDDEGRFVVAETEAEAKQLFKSEFKIEASRLSQDEDVLDTWFSSWLWPIEVFNGITQPNNPDINYYYPGQYWLQARI